MHVHISRMDAAFVIERRTKKGVYLRKMPYDGSVDASDDSVVQRVFSAPPHGNFFNNIDTKCTDQAVAT